MHFWCPRIIFYFREMKLEQWKYITAQREIYNFTILQVSVDEWQ